MSSQVPKAGTSVVHPTGPTLRDGVKIQERVAQAMSWAEEAIAEVAGIGRQPVGARVDDDATSEIPLFGKFVFEAFATVAGAEAVSVKLRVNLSSISGEGTRVGEKKDCMN